MSWNDVLKTHPPEDGFYLVTLSSRYWDGSVGDLRSVSIKPYKQRLKSFYGLNDTVEWTHRVVAWAILPEVYSKEVANKQMA